MPMYPIQTPFGQVFVSPQDTDRMAVVTKSGSKLKVNGVHVSCQFIFVKGADGTWGVEKLNRYSRLVYRPDDKKVSRDAAFKVESAVTQVFMTWTSSNEDKVISAAKVGVHNEISHVDNMIASAERQLADLKAERAKLVAKLNETA